MSTRFSVLLAAFALGSCGSKSHEDPESRDAEVDSAVHEPDPCDGVWLPGPLAVAPEPGFVCSVHLVHEPLAYYDDCLIEGGTPAPEACGAPSVGTVICQINGWSHVGRRTTSCLQDGDCPEGMLCTYGEIPQPIDPAVVWAGVCERRCAENGDCLRCDMQCDLEHEVCWPSREPEPEPVPCEADCQCNWPAGNKCVNGTCIESDAPRVGLCPGDCLCTGGECGDDHCCHLPDGSIADSLDEACLPAK